MLSTALQMAAQYPARSISGIANALGKLLHAKLASEKKAVITAILLQWLPSRDTTLASALSMSNKYLSPSAYELLRDALDPLSRRAKSQVRYTVAEAYRKLTEDRPSDRSSFYKILRRLQSDIHYEVRSAVFGRPN